MAGRFAARFRPSKLVFNGAGRWRDARGPAAGRDEKLTVWALLRIATISRLWWHSGRHAGVRDGAGDRRRRPGREERSASHRAATIIRDSQKCGGGMEAAAAQSRARHSAQCRSRQTLVRFEFSPARQGAKGREIRSDVFGGNGRGARPLLSRLRPEYGGAANACLPPATLTECAAAPAGCAGLFSAPPPAAAFPAERHEH